MEKLLIYDEIRIGYVGNIEMRLGGVSNRSLKQMIMMRSRDFDMFRSCEFSLPAFTLFLKEFNGWSQALA